MVPSPEPRGPAPPAPAGAPDPSSAPFPEPFLEGSPEPFLAWSPEPSPTPSPEPPPVRPPGTFPTPSPGPSPVRPSVSSSARRPEMVLTDRMLPQLPSSDGSGSGTLERMFCASSKVQQVSPARKARVSASGTGISRKARSSGRSKRFPSKSAIWIPEAKSHSSVVSLVS